MALGSLNWQWCEKWMELEKDWKQGMTQGTAEVDRGRNGEEGLIGKALLR